MDAILAEWADHTKGNQTLYAKFTRTDMIQAWKDRSVFDGVAVLKSPNRAYLNFNKFDANGKPQPHERIIVTPENVYQFDSPKKQVHIYQMADNPQQRALDEGPLPFLFDMNVEKARQRYAMTFYKEDEQYYYIIVDPRADADRGAFRPGLDLLEQEDLPSRSHHPVRSEQRQGHQDLRHRRGQAQPAPG